MWEIGVIYDPCIVLVVILTYNIINKKTSNVILLNLLE